MNRLINVILIAGLFRGLNWLATRWSERGGPARTQEERRRQKTEARAAHRKIGMMRRISRWMR